MFDEWCGGGGGVENVRVETGVRSSQDTVSCDGNQYTGSDCLYTCAEGGVLGLGGERVREEGCDSYHM